MARTLRVAAVQFEMRPVESYDEFAEQVKSALDEAGPGHQVIVLPELFTSGLFTVDPDWQSHGLEEFTRIAAYTDRYRVLFAEEATARGAWILAGSTLLQNDRGYENVAFLFSPDGREFRHSKTHIFPAEGQWDTQEGETLEVVEIDGVKVGISICYETEIPEVTTILARKGAEVVLVPSYTFTEAGFYRVRHCAAARAIENQVYMVHCPTTGKLDAPLSPGWGRPSILGPCDLAFPADGVIAEGATNRQSVVSAELDLDLLHENRKTGAATTHFDRERRADLYGRYREFQY